MSFIKDLLQRKPQDQTIFTATEIAQLLEIYPRDKLYSALKYAVQKKDIIRIARNYYSFSANYSFFELGNKLRRPSYISLYSILQEEGVIFQPYNSIFLISNRSEKVVIDSMTYVYRCIKKEILLNTTGIVVSPFISKATKERALCDKIYLDGPEYFDNVRNINWSLMKTLNKEVYNCSKKIKQFIKENAHERT